MNKIHFLLFTSIILCLSCNNPKTNDIKTVDFYNFKMNIPMNWQKVNRKGIDSNIGYIITDKQDTIQYDFGKYSPKFKVTSKVFADSLKAELSSIDRDVFTPFFSETPEYDNALGTYMKEYYYYKTIDNNKALFKIPKHKGSGIIGLFVDDIKDKRRLTIWCEDLSPEFTDLLIKSFSTIKFKK